MEPDLTVSPHRARHLTEPEDAPQGGRRELMPGEYVLDASAINQLVITCSDNPGQLARGERVGHGQPHNVLLDMLGETRLE